LIIPWRVDVPGERLPFINWLIITGTITAFFFQTVSVYKRKSMLPAKMNEYTNRSVEEVAKEFGVEEKRLKKIEQAAEKTARRLKEFISRKYIYAEFKNQLIKKAILMEYFAWGKIRPFILNGWKITGLLGYIWLHGGILHLLGNMLFLWIFGNAVCAKIGNFRYLPTYIGLGFIAGISQVIFAGGSGIGASGAINGIMGMFLVFFPQNEIACYFIFFFPLLIRPYCKELCMSSYWMILFWLAFDIWGVIKGGGRVAYFAHVGGFAAGFCIAVLMLKLKMVTMERYEKSLLQIIADYKNPPKDEFQPQYGGHLGLLQKEIEEQPEPQRKIFLAPKPCL
jgi:membrane associated rhomboid family serine protease